ncbi:hypothetical protein [Alienimonas californiensis]|uniref:Uncharacterized protein n=1 Tax=Alienimonas californiensis TaxID=2527989 RepID=A0A517P7T4_9PLAN|nr:hypothetical protein [Alienimonas californiensis]QDT15439.1 hypothetical protein CA12_15240 [Alienimonas californiensis]
MLASPLAAVFAGLLLAADPPPEPDPPAVVLQEPQEAPADRPESPEVRKLTVSPAPLPDPPLRYRLTMPEEDRRPGSAVTYWYRAELVLTQAETNRVRDAEGEPVRSLQEIAGELLLSDSSDQLTPERIGRAFGTVSWEEMQVFEQMEAAARRGPADWGFGLDGIDGRESVSFLLPEIQEVRGLARLIALRGRARVGRGDLDKALADARVALRLSEDAGRAPFLIADLVGLAVGTITRDHLIEAIVAAPDSPNLYNALAELPDPAAGLADSWDFELSLPHRFAPWLKDAETRDWSAERWRTAWVELYRDIYELDGRGETDPEDAAAAVARLLADRAPAERAALIETGMNRGAVEAMPAGQVLAVAEGRTWRRVADAARVALALPPRDAYAALANVEAMIFAAGGVEEAPDRGGEFDLRGRETGLASVTNLPAIRRAYQVVLRAKTDLAALRTIEALRAHAATAGAFPQSLSEVDAVPVPDNPLTGEAFGYQLEGETAVLNVVRHPTLTSVNRIYRLTLRDE